MSDNPDPTMMQLDNDQQQQQQPGGNGGSSGGGGTGGGGEGTPRGREEDVEWFCHECHISMKPLMLPDPHCPNCHGTFVERIEDPSNDPRNFDPELPLPPEGGGGNPFFMGGGPGFQYMAPGGGPMFGGGGGGGGGGSGGVSGLLEQLFGLMGPGGPDAPGSGQRQQTPGAGAGDEPPPSPRPAPAQPPGAMPTGAPTGGDEQHAGQEGTGSQQQQGQWRQRQGRLGPFNYNYRTTTFDGPAGGSGGGGGMTATLFMGGRGGGSDGGGGGGGQEVPLGWATFGPHPLGPLGSRQAPRPRSEGNQPRQQDGGVPVQNLADFLHGAFGPLPGEEGEDHENRDHLRGEDDPDHDHDHGQEFHGLPPNHPLASLFQLFGAMGMAGPGGPGNAGDYVLTQQGFEEVMQRLMDQASGHQGAPPASEDEIKELPKCTMTEELIKQSTIADCAICKDEFQLGDEAQKMPCRHVFHVDCLQPWLEIHGTCPVCRASIKPDAPPPTSPPASTSASQLPSTPSTATSPPMEGSMLPRSLDFLFNGGNRGTTGTTFPSGSGSGLGPFSGSENTNTRSNNNNNNRPQEEDVWEDLPALEDVD